MHAHAIPEPEYEPAEERIRFYTFATPQDCAVALADAVTAAAQEGVARDGRATVVFSGGSTPKPFFRALHARPAGQAFPWARTMLTLADERWLPADHPDSNERLLRDHLLTAETYFTGLKTAHPSPEGGVAEVESRFQQIKRPFDAVVLGMGDDGHTASLFPRAPRLAQALDLHTKALCMAMPTPTSPGAAPYPRMTLTLAALLNSGHIFLHVTGESKRAVLERAIVPGPVEEYPIRAILTQTQVPVSVYWAG